MSGSRGGVGPLEGRYVDAKQRMRSYDVLGLGADGAEAIIKG